MKKYGLWRIKKHNTENTEIQIRNISRWHMIDDNEYMDCWLLLNDINVYKFMKYVQNTSAEINIFNDWISFFLIGDTLQIRVLNKRTSKGWQRYSKKYRLKATLIHRLFMKKSEKNDTIGSTQKNWFDEAIKTAKMCFLMPMSRYSWF